MSGSKSRTKGQRGERQAAKLLTKLLGKKWRRSQQIKGTQDSPDVETVEIDTDLWTEVKYDQSTISKKMYQVMETAKEEAGDKKVPFLMSRRNYEEWLFVVSEENLIDFCREIVRLLD